jgi:hypothetical protein
MSPFSPLGPAGTIFVAYITHWAAEARRVWPACWIGITSASVMTLATGSWSMRVLGACAIVRCFLGRVFVGDRHVLVRHEVVAEVGDD